MIVWLCVAHLVNLVVQVAICGKLLQGPINSNALCGACVRLFKYLIKDYFEEFAAALRVTMAEVLAEAYDGTLPVLFDDAFANSDPERQAGVFRMLQQAADQGLQVILLTCDPERSRGIEGASHTSLGL